MIARFFLDPGVRFATGRPVLTVALASLLAATSVVFTAVNLRLEPDRNALIRSGRDWNERFEQYRRNFGGTQDFIVVVKGGTASRREAFVDALILRLERDGRVDSVFGRVDPDAFQGSRLVLMGADGLRRLRENLEENAEALATIAEEPSLEALLAWVDQRVSRALVRTLVSGLFGEDTRAEGAEPVDLSFVLNLLEGMNRSLKGEVVPNSPFSDGLFSSESRGRGYLTVRGGAIYLVSVGKTLDGPRAVSDGQMLDGLNSHLARLEQDFPDIEAGITGQRAINVAELRATVEDTRLAGILALFGIALVFVVGFGRARHPLLAVAALMLGVSWSAGALTLVVGHLTVLSVAFTSILLGLGIDFGIHIVARFEARLHLGDPVVEAARRAVLLSGPGNVAGAVTTSLAFFGVGFSDFLGLAELGIIAGMGVLLCLLSQLTVLPALLVLAAGKSSSRLRSGGNRLFARLDRSPRTFFGVGIAVAALGYLAGPLVRFDGNLLRLQAEGLTAVDLELELIGAQGSAFAVARVPSLGAARALAPRFLALPEVSRVESVADVLPEDAAERIRSVKDLRPWVPAASVEKPGPMDARRLKKRLERLRFKLRPEAERRWDDAQRPEQADLVRARTLLGEVLDHLETGGDRARLEAYERLLGKELAVRLGELEVETANPKAPKLSDLPAPLRERLVGRDGTLLLRIHPAENIWEDEARARFVAAIRRIDPEVTGIPVQSFEASQLMLRGYVEGGTYSLLLVILVLAISLRSVRHILFALTPLAVGAGWTLLFMAVLGLRFNLANLIILPLMIGIGIDIGVHLVHRFREDGQVGGALASSSTGRAVLLSSVTTMVGFGTLTLAAHRGIHSLGLLLVIGVLANLGAALFVQAPGLRWAPRP